MAKAVTKRVIEEVKQVALGQALDLETSRRNCLANFAKLNVTDQMIFDLFGISKIEEIDKEKVFELRGIWNAIKEGDTTVQEAFVKPIEERNQAAAVKAKAEEAKAKAQAAASRTQQPNE